MERQLAKEIRLLGMERIEVAKKVGVSLLTLSNWIRGIHPINPVGVRILQKIGIPKEAIRNPSEEV